VVGEVVLDAPQGVEAERFEEIGQTQLCEVHLAIAATGHEVLEDRRGTDSHEQTPTVVKPANQARCRRPRWGPVATSLGLGSAPREIDRPDSALYTPSSYERSEVGSGPRVSPRRCPTGVGGVGDRADELQPARQRARDRPIVLNDARV